MALDLATSSTVPTANATREFVFSLIAGLEIPASRLSNVDLNPLRGLPEPQRNILLTLYALFEHELLPALDLLDRGLVARLKVSSQNSPYSTEDNRIATPTYLVRSVHPHHTRNQYHEHINCHEVRLQAWTCSCPAFVFSAFPDFPTQPQWPSGDRPNSGCDLQMMEPASDMPICKHILACALVEQSATFKGFMDDDRISPEDVAGWAAGWGD